MIKNRSIINEVLASYPAKKNQRAFLLQQEEERLLKNDEYLKTVNLLAELTFDAQKADFEGNAAEKERLDKKIGCVRLEREALRKSLGFNPSTLPWECPACKDEGVVDGKYCDCFYKKITDACYKELGISSQKLVTFKDDTLSQKNGTGAFFEKFKKYCDGFNPSSKNLMLTGQTGTGKTFLAQAVASEIATKNAISIFIPATELNDIFVENMYQPPIRQKEIFDILTTCDFLVIDDLGAERLLNNVTAQNLYALISERQNLSKPFMITTNLTLDELSIRYADRLFSRLTAKSTVTLNLVGQDLRKCV